VTRAVACGLALSLAACCYGGGESGGAAPRPGARMERIAEEVLRDYPDVQRYFAGMDYDESFAAGAALAQRGLPRLSDAELVAFAGLRARLLESASDEACAAIVGGGAAQAAMTAMDAMPEEDLRAFSRLTTRAQSLELQGGPRPLSPEAASAGLAEGVTRIREALSDEDRARWEAAISSAAPADACTVERLAMREASRMDRGGAFVRAMLESAASAPGQ
jgi:hypothetical protein